MEPNRESLDVPPHSATDIAGAAAVPLAHVESVEVVIQTSGGDAFSTPSNDAVDADADAAVTNTDAANVDSAEADIATTDAALAADEPQPDIATAPPDPVDTLSPAVRRLVRQYDLDVTGIHGTGPSGRIRVGDVIGMLGGRADGANRATDGARSPGGFNEDTVVEARLAGTPYRGITPARAPEPAAAAAAAATTVYECDVSHVLAHRKAQRRNNVETLITSYFLVACGEALRAVPEAVAGGGDGSDVQLGVLLAAADGEERTTLVDAVDTIDDSGPLASLDSRLRSFDQALRAIGDAPLREASLLVHHYGLSGSLLATPTTIGAGHVASVGIGRVRRQIIVKTTDGDEAPRVAAMCYVTLTFLPDRLPLHRANRFVTQLVRVLEQWPD
jgi:pyruvate/2-oxoglutarate dehydrogenase complex dihydrolipoamide acyltransferase (E2) component